MRIYITLHEYQPTEQFKTYLYQIIRNLGIDFIHQQHPIEQGDTSEFPITDATKIN